MKHLVWMIALATAAPLTFNAAAGDKASCGLCAPKKTTAEMKPGRQAVRLSNMMGATVHDRAGDTVGTLQDVVFDPATGHAQFGVVRLQEGENSGRLAAIPWPLVQTSGDAKHVKLALKGDRIERTYTFDSTVWPDFSEPSYARRIYSHYGLSHPVAEMGGTTTIYGETSDEPRKRSDNAFPRPAPDGREVFGELDKYNKTDR